MAMPSRRPPQKSMRVGGGALKRHQKQNRKKLRKSTQNSSQKVIQKGDGTLKRTGKHNVSIFLNLRHPNARKFKTICFSTYLQRWRTLKKGFIQS